MRRALDGVQRENKFILTRLLLLQVELTKREIFFIAIHFYHSKLMF